VVKVSATGCLSNCTNGPVLVCYPKAEWYRIRSRADADILIAGFEREWVAERKKQKAAGKKDGLRRPLFKPETGIPLRALLQEGSNDTHLSSQG
jgi:(2Fe-2S) ferredoxin